MLLLLISDLWLLGINDIVGVDDPDVLDQIMSARRKNKEVYAWFLDNIVSFVVGCVTWKANTGSSAMSVVASVGDEAMGLLIVENSWEVWRERCNLKGMETLETLVAKKTMIVPIVEASPDATVVAAANYSRGDGRDKAHRLLVKAVPLYTNQNSGSKESGGWSRAGILRFNVLATEVAEERKTKAAEYYDVWYQARQRERFGQGRKRKRNVITDGEPVIPYVEL